MLSRSKSCAWRATLGLTIHARCGRGPKRSGGAAIPAVAAAEPYPAPVLVVAVVPTYNEAENLPELVALLRKAVAGITVMVVDDDSPDGTADVARRIAAEHGDLDVLVRYGRRGLGSAYRDGFRQAIADGADVCVQIDADLSHDPADLPALLANIEHGADLAIGSRYVPGGRTEGWSWRRRWLSRWGNRYAAGLLGLAVNDATGGYRAYRAAALDAMGYDDVTAEGYGFQIEMTHRLVRAGGRIVEFPIEFRDRRTGESKLSQGIVGEAFGLVLRLWLDDRRDRRTRRRRSG